MRIAQVAPLHEAVPPKLYGGTERVVSYLTEELVRLGYDVTLFASGDSETSARLVPITPQALRLDKSTADPIAPHFVLLKTVKQMQNQFDIIHFHTDYLHFPLAESGLRTPHVTTIHNRMDLPELRNVYRAFPDIPLISISQSQRNSLPDCNWVGTVHHGLPRDLYATSESRGGDLVFLGRISPEKRLDRAIKIADLAGKRLVVAAKVDQHDRTYFESEIKPLLDQPHVKYLGEIGDREKHELICSALAMLFPIDWPEPFGIVMIESMACGVPVIAWRNGSVPEVINLGRSGFVVESIDEAVAAVHACEQLTSQQVREEFENRFTSDIMANNYLKIYEAQLLKALGKFHIQRQDTLSHNARTPLRH